MSICKSLCLQSASLRAKDLSANLTPLVSKLIDALGWYLFICFISTNKLSPISVGSPPVMPNDWVFLSMREISLILNDVLSVSCATGGCGHIMHLWLQRSVANIALCCDCISYKKIISPLLLMVTTSPSWKSSTWLMLDTYGFRESFTALLTTTAAYPEGIHAAFLET